MSIGELCAKVAIAYEWADEQQVAHCTRDDLAAYFLLGEKDGWEFVSQRFVARHVA